MHDRADPAPCARAAPPVNALPGKYALLALLSLLWWSAALRAAEPLHILVESAHRTLTVYQGERILDFFANISVGRNGATSDRRRGDNRTPLGTFRVAWINRVSPYDIFIGLDYPTPEIAEKAYDQERIDARTLRAIRTAFDEGRLPPQDTELGGFIGIHGLGHADPHIHKAMNWTQGCIALTNEQIERLVRWVKIGTPVEIR